MLHTIIYRDSHVKYFPGAHKSVKLVCMGKSDHVLEDLFFFLNQFLGYTNKSETSLFYWKELVLAHNY